MDEQLFLVQSNVTNFIGVCGLTFKSPNSVIITDSYDCVRAQIRILSKFCIPHIFKQDFVPLVLHVFFSFAIFLMISLLN